MIAKDIVYRREVWQTLDGRIVRAPLPKEVKGSHFGYQLRALVHNLYALGMTEPALFEFLVSSGIEISEGQVHNILMSESETYHSASEAILSAGLAEASYIRVAGLIGFISETILKPEQVLLSDRAGQFAIFDHAGCWVHMERPLRKLKVSALEAEKELEQVRDAIWNLYDKVKKHIRKYKE